MRKLIAVLAAVPLLMAASLEVSAHPGEKGDRGAKLKARMRGEAEVPGPGDQKDSPGEDGRPGRGHARVRLSKDGNLCFRIKWENIAQPTAGHIHTGTAGVAGPVAVTLFSEAPEDENSTSGCVEGVDLTLMRSIHKSPSDYYVNLHNAEFPEGAIRGQLRHDNRKKKDDAGESEEREDKGDRGDESTETREDKDDEGENKDDGDAEKDDEGEDKDEGDADDKDDEGDKDEGDVKDEGDDDEGDDEGDKACDNAGLSTAKDDCDKDDQGEGKEDDGGADEDDRDLDDERPDKG